MSVINPDKVAAYLFANHVGCDRAVSAEDLILGVCGYCNPSLKRDLSDIVGLLRTRGYPVFADSHGYYWATEPHQIVKLCKLLHKRAMTALKQITKLKHIAIPDLAGQLRLPVGSEPELPLVPRRSFNATTMSVEIPEDLHEALIGFLQNHPSWDCDRLYVAALSLFLLQQGSDAQAPRHYYLEANCDDAS